MMSQHVNKTESACQITHIPTGIWTRIQESREQQANKKRAMEVIKEKLFQVEFDKWRGSQNQKRQTQVGTGDRSEKIRTYNFPQDRMSDTRTNLTLYGIDKFFSGESIDTFIDTMLEKEFEAKVKNLFNELNTE